MNSKDYKRIHAIQTEPVLPRHRKFHRDISDTT